MILTTPEFDEGLSQRLPLPLAQLYRRAHSAKTASEHYLNAFYLWEAAIKLLSSGALARYAAVGERAPEVEALVFGSFDRPELRDWWECGRMVVARLAARGDAGFAALRDGLSNRAHNDLPHAAQLNVVLAEFAGGRRVARSTVRLAELIERLIEFRGQEVGHQAASARGDDFYARWAPLLLAGASEVLGRVDVLAGRQLAFRNALDGVAWWHLTGERPTPLADRASWSGPRSRHPGCLYLLDRDSADPPDPLEPLALFNPGGGHFFYYQQGREGVDYTYLNYTTGELRQSTPRWFVTDLLAGTVPESESAPLASEPTADGTHPQAPAVEPPVRKKLGEFELLGELGRGGMGVVYRAWQPSLGREVALKRLPWTGSARAEERFRREIEALSRVDHPNLIRIYTFGADGEDRYYTMELVEGVGLDAVNAAARSSRVPAPVWPAVVGAAWAERWEPGSRERSQATNLPPVGAPRFGRGAIRQVVELIIQVADAAQALHAAGVVHRDIKPANVSIDRTGTRATLMDLGIAHLMEGAPDTRTGTGQIIGTPRYASPEQLRGRKVDPRADVYSLGATLWESLTLHQLFGPSGTSPWELYQRVQTEEPGRPRAINPVIDPVLDAIVLKCLAKNPADRYATAQALADDLRRWLEGAAPSEDPGRPLIPGRASSARFDLTFDAPPAGASGVFDVSSGEIDLEPVSGSVADIPVGFAASTPDIDLGASPPVRPSDSSVLSASSSDSDLTTVVTRDESEDESKLSLRDALKNLGGALEPFNEMERSSSARSWLRLLLLLAVAVACGLAVANITAQMSAGPKTESRWLATSGGWALAAVFAATTVWQWRRVRHLRAELDRRDETELVQLLAPDTGASPPPIEHTPIPSAHPAEPSGSPDVPSEHSPLPFPCPFCGRRMGVPADLLGKQVRCPNCKQVVLAPRFSPSPMLPAEPVAPAPSAPSVADVPLGPTPPGAAGAWVAGVSAGGRPPAFSPPVPETTRPLVTAARPKLRTGDEAFSSQTVVLRYPAPVAIAYRRFCARKEPPDRLAQLFSTFEITVKYLVYLAHSDLARVRVNAGPPYEPLPGYSGFDFTRRPVRMTLGQWLEALRTAADELKKQPDRFFAELPDVCRTGGSLDREIVQWIKTNRNVWAHIEDGQSLTTEECSRLLPEARPRLERLFQEIDFVRRYPLGFVTAGYPGSGDLMRYRVHSCMGARVAHGEEVYPMETTVRFPVGVPFVVRPDESAALCLWPFLLYRESDATQRPALYVFRGIEKDERFMAAVEAVAIDHKDTWSKRLHPTAAADHNWLWEALAKLPQTVAITPELRLADGLAESLVGRLTGEALGASKHIRLIGPIARGGFGTVYDAFDTERNVRVAVKVLEDREGLDPKEDMAQFKRFQQEYEKLQRAGAATAGFVRTFEWGTSIIGRREYPWFSMEFAAGGDLTARLEERRIVLQDKLPWTEPEVREAVVTEFRAVAGAVANLHELNIVHRDVKPGNILVMDGGELRLSDFGLVKDLDRPRVGVSVGPGSTRGAVVGTRDYMAPEQERGETVTRAADVYALGILLAELTTGRRPLSSAGAVAGSPIERDDRVMKLPEALRRLIARCTDLDPESRPEDAGHVLLEFEKVARKHA